MSSDIISNLQLDEEFTTGRVLVAKEISGCDSAFIVSCVLGHCIKNKTPLLVVTMHNSAPHYQNVGLKMNYNLQRHIDTGLINFFNLGKIYIDFLMNNENVSLQDLLSELKEKIGAMKDKHGTVSVILDGVSHLFDLNYTLTEVNMFCRSLITLVRSFSNSFVMFHCNVAGEDDVTHVLSNLLSQAAHTVLEVQSLSSGWSADVSGHLVVSHLGQKFDQDHMFIDLKPSKYLFKLFDRGVKLFAPGTVPVTPIGLKL